MMNGSMKLSGRRMVSPVQIQEASANFLLVRSVAGSHGHLNEIDNKSRRRELRRSNSMACAAPKISWQSSMDVTLSHKHSYTGQQPTMAFS